jgi:xanthine/uracil permease
MALAAVTGIILNLILPEGKSPKLDDHILAKDE